MVTRVKMTMRKSIGHKLFLTNPYFYVVCAFSSFLIIFSLFNFILSYFVDVFRPKKVNHVSITQTNVLLAVYYSSSVGREPVSRAFGRQMPYSRLDPRINHRENQQQHTVLFLCWLCSSYLPLFCRLDFGPHHSVSLVTSPCRAFAFAFALP